MSGPEKADAEEIEEHECVACGRLTTFAVTLDDAGVMLPACQGWERCWHYALSLLCVILGDECPIPVERV